jgi:hypothetical protein
MLKTHLAEVKHQGEPKIRHSKPLDRERLLHLLSNRTASLPSPHPIGLQSRCSALLDSLPIRLHWPQLCARSTHHQDPRPSGCARPWTPPPTPLESPPLKSPAPQALPGPSSTWDDRIHTLLGSLPLRIPTSQALPGPSSMWNDQNHAPLGSPLLGPS